MSLFESVTPTVRLAKSGTGIGIVTHGDKALFLDSGLDENLARRVCGRVGAMWSREVGP